MKQERLQIMEKARVKRRRRLAAKLERRRTREATQPTKLTDKVIELAQGAATQVGELAKTVACGLGATEG